MKITKSFRATMLSLIGIISITLFLFKTAFAYTSNGDKLVAITIDDLPFVGEYRNFHLNLIMQTLKNEKVPATGFIIAKEVSKKNWEILQKFKDSGFGLGNHTYSHANLARLKLSKGIIEIEKADKKLSRFLTWPKYFRYPYLAMGRGEKKNQLLCVLSENQYQAAPITIDSRDFAFNQRLLAVPENKRRLYLSELKPFYLEFIEQQTLRSERMHRPPQAQILLIHANLLNAYSLIDIIHQFRNSGYKFITLKEALTTFKHLDYCHQTTPHRSMTTNNDQNNSDYLDWD